MHTGTKTKETVVDWANKMARPPSQELECEDLRNRYFNDYYDFGYDLLHNYDELRAEEVELRYEKFNISIK